MCVDLRQHGSSTGDRRIQLRAGGGRLLFGRGRLPNRGLLSLLLGLNGVLGGADLGDQVAAGRIRPAQHVDARQQIRERARCQHVGNRIAAAVLVGGHQLPRQHRLGGVQAATAGRELGRGGRLGRACGHQPCPCRRLVRGRHVPARLQLIEAVHHRGGLLPLGADRRGAGGRSGRDDQRQHDQRSGQCARQGMNPPAMCQLCSPRKQTGCPQAPVFERRNLTTPAGGR